MSEAVALAGSAVGITSLGIQVCQGLLSYYHDWKNYDEDMKTTTDAISDLEQKFALLKDVLNSPRLAQDHKIRDGVTQSLVQCEKGLSITSLHVRYETTTSLLKVPNLWLFMTNALTIRQV